MDEISKVTIEDVIKNASSYIDEKGLDVVKRAYDFAKEIHAGEKRLSGEDYIHHCVAVAYILTKYMRIMLLYLQGYYMNL